MDYSVYDDKVAFNMEYNGPTVEDDVHRLCQRVNLCVIVLLHHVKRPIWFYVKKVQIFGMVAEENKWKYGLGVTPL